MSSGQCGSMRAEFHICSQEYIRTGFGVPEKSSVGNAWCEKDEPDVGNKEGREKRGLQRE